MSDLDKAIRDHLARVIDETMERRNGLTSILPGTEMSRVLSAVQKLIDDHKPIGIYEECGHSHRGDEPGVREFDDVGLVCADGLMYEVCASCCDWNPLSGQTEHCVTTHDHHHGGVHCMVIYSVSESLGVSGEDRSEPTPAPDAMPEARWKSGDRVDRPAWGWRGTVKDVAPERNRYLVCWDHLLDELLSEGASWCTGEELTEVVTLEGTP